MEERTEAEIERLSDFFDMDLSPPAYDTTWGMPYYAPETDTVYLSRTVPRDAIHETRHAVHRQVIASVVSAYPDDVQALYADELYGLPATDRGWEEHIAARFTDIPAADDLYDRIQGSDQPVDELLSAAYARKLDETARRQSEFFAENGTSLYRGGDALVTGGGVVAAGILSAHAITAGVSPESAFFTGTALLLTGWTGDHSHYLYTGLQAEPLTETTLAAYTPGDRRRAMLYHPAVADSIDGFLSVLDSYGIGLKTGEVASADEERTIKSRGETV